MTVKPPETSDGAFELMFEDFLGMAAYFAKSSGGNYWKTPLNKYAEFLLVEFKERLDAKQYGHPERVERVKDSISSS